ncbi:uncharacterized protein B0I36DRAFT_412995 [Microdochium trichocladiopsis]|uniref:Uncharacterized protein n=1 Tax=Microdochium trichocladiopsis TaxID=1682393 RepID=A0A9P9BNM1_9PEZI|nr:uncharacterized protein B0I36DRAFT_412995 [Microdochium trichocladiopsis]KAH7027564.1 hypothetical protein B0I36DRAFT_412995 [Microdochium trichocladiopsis]
MRCGDKTPSPKSLAGAPALHHRAAPCRPSAARPPLAPRPPSSPPTRIPLFSLDALILVLLCSPASAPASSSPSPQSSAQSVNQTSQSSWLPVCLITLPDNIGPAASPRRSPLPTPARLVSSTASVPANPGWIWQPACAPLCSTCFDPHRHHFSFADYTPRLLPSLSYNLAYDILHSSNFSSRYPGWIAASLLSRRPFVTLIVFFSPPPALAFGSQASAS